jgi:hypothetical protein
MDFRRVFNTSVLFKENHKSFYEVNDKEEERNGSRICRIYDGAILK